jgi:cytochrome c-type biogenesis protein CcmH
VKFVFYAAAAAMIAVALALLLVPLVRSGRLAGRPKGIFALALLVAFIVPLGTIGLYALVGTPVTLNGVDKKPTDQQSIGEAISELRDRLAQQPNDVQGWLLLGQTFGMLKQPVDARDAYDGALKAAPDNTVAMVGWAEADSLASQDHRIDGRARDLLLRAVQIDPQNQRGLWLLGISDFQLEKFADASAVWRRLQPLLEPGTPVAKAVTEQIAVAEARMGGTPTPGKSADAPAPTNAPQLNVDVSLAPALKSKVAAGDTLFVYARAENGPPMPLAVARLQANALPASVVLTDGMGMTPQFRLSSASRVFVAARISKSGQAIGQPGDLEGDAGILDTATRTPIRITIDHIR